MCADENHRQLAMASPAASGIGLSADGRHLWVALSLVLAILTPPRLSGQERPVLKVPTLIQSLAFSPTGNAFAAGFEGSRTTLVYDARRLEQLASIRGEFGHVQALAFSPDGKQLAIPDAWQGSDGKESIGVRLW